MAEWNWCSLGELTKNYNSARRATKSSERVSGGTPYYGASGQIDKVHGHTHEGEFLLLAEDGENLRSRGTPIAFLAKGRIWVNNHAHVLAGLTSSDTRFLGYALSQTDITGYLTGSAQPKLNKAAMESIRLFLPPEPQRKAIAEVLGALDDKIATNDRLVDLSDRLAEAITFASLDGCDGPLISQAIVTMGSSPPGVSYNEAGEGAPFYQGVRDFGVRFPKKRIWTTSPVRMADANDTLVSVRAPVGRTNLANEALCLGRGIASVRSRTSHPMTLFHQVRAAQAAWAPYEAEGTVFGAINRKQLGMVRIRAIRNDRVENLERELGGLEDRISAALEENRVLAATRDELLPLLMSGKLRVKDAERAVEEIV